MSPTVDIQRSSNSPAATRPDAAQWIELYFPRIEDLLHRLAETRTVKKYALPVPRFGSWKMAAVCAVCFICVPGYATPAGILPIKSDNTGVPPLATEPAVDPVFTKADRLPLITPIAIVNDFSDATYFDEVNFLTSRQIVDEADLFEQPPLRGTVEDVVLQVPPAEAVASKRKLRRSVGAAFAKMLTEPPEPAPRSRSLIEKLFSGFVPQFLQPPSQREM